MLTNEQVQNLIDRAIEELDSLKNIKQETPDVASEVRARELAIGYLEQIQTLSKGEQRSVDNKDKLFYLP